MKNLRLLMLCIGLCFVGVSNATLLVHLNLDETTGTVADDSGTNNNHDGTLSAATGQTFDFSTNTVTGQFGNALNFTGGPTNGKVVVNTTDATTLPGKTGGTGLDFTFSFWTKRSNSWSADTERSAIFSYAVNGFRFTLGLNQLTVATGNPCYLVAKTFDLPTTPNYSCVYADVASVTTNAWHHIAAVVDDGYITLYLDGVDVGTSNTGAGGWSCTAGSGLYLGCRYSSSASYFYNGAIDDFAILGEALTSQQISAIYSSSNPIPEPATIALVALGFGAICTMRKK